MGAGINLHNLYKKMPRYRSPKIAGHLLPMFVANEVIGYLFLADYPNTRVLTNGHQTRITTGGGGVDAE